MNARTLLPLAAATLVIAACTTQVTLSERELVEADGSPALRTTTTTTTDTTRTQSGYFGSGNIVDVDTATIHP